LGYSVRALRRSKMVSRYTGSLTSELNMIGCDKKHFQEVCHKGPSISHFWESPMASSQVRVSDSVATKISVVDLVSISF
jgi:hypothetical protein